MDKFLITLISILSIFIAPPLQVTYYGPEGPRGTYEVDTTGLSTQEIVNIIKDKWRINLAPRCDPRFDNIQMLVGGTPLDQVPEELFPADKLDVSVLFEESVLKKSPHRAVAEALITELASFEDEYVVCAFNRRGVVTLRPSDAHPVHNVKIMVSSISKHIKESEQINVLRLYYILIRELQENSREAEETDLSPSAPLFYSSRPSDFVCPEYDVGNIKVRFGLPLLVIHAPEGMGSGSLNRVMITPKHDITQNIMQVQMKLSDRDRDVLLIPELRHLIGKDGLLTDPQWGLFKELTRYLAVSGAVMV